MRCVYIGNFQKSYSSENYIYYGLKQNGCQVIRWDENRYPDKFIEKIKDCEPDFVLFCKPRGGGNWLSLIKQLKSERILTVTWLFDLYFNLPKEMGTNRNIFEPQFYTDLVFTSDGGHSDLWKKNGINHFTLRQGIHELEANFGKKIDAQEIGFIGSCAYQKRWNLIKAIRNRYGDRFVHYGQSGTRGEVRGEQLNDLVSSLKIVIGDSVPSDNYWSNRIYEILGRGGFLIHPKVNGLENEFQYYKHFIPFDYGDYTQLFRLIDYYLIHDKEREKIRKAGHKFVKEHYTYTKRCQKLIQEVQKHIGMSV